MNKIQKLLTTTDKTVFKLRDFANIWGYNEYDSLKKIVKYYVNNGELKRISKGYYYIADKGFNQFEFANKLRSSSYISFETVLRENNVIFQYDEVITLASGDTESFLLEKPEMKFKFRKLKPSVLYNTDGIYEKDNYYIATKERALLDMLYINPKFQLDNLNDIDWEECIRLVEIYGNKSLTKLVKKMQKDVR
jgi:hypothetical protein